MKNLLRIYLFAIALVNTFLIQSSHASAIEYTQKSAENQIKSLITPLLEKYCSDDCKLMGVKVNVDIASKEEIAPGFDDIEIKKNSDLAPSSAQIKLLIDNKIGPISRTKLLELLQQYLDTLDYPVKIDTQITHFPLPHGSEVRIAAIRSKIENTFLTNTNDLIQQFCPHACILTDFNLQTEVVNAEEAQYGSNSEFVQDGDTATKIKEISATILMDQTLSPDEQSNIIEMIKLKNSTFKNLTINGKSLRFPRSLITGNLSDDYSSERNPASASNSDSKSDSNSDSKSNTTNSESKTNSENRTNSENNSRNEKYSRYEKIERIENGNAVQAELHKFKIFGLIFAFSAIALLLFIAISSVRVNPSANNPNVQRMIHNFNNDSLSQNSVQSNALATSVTNQENNAFQYSRRFEIERIYEDLMAIYAQQPKVAKHVFSKVLTEEGVETTAECISIFGEGIVVEMLRDPSLQTDVTELLEYYSKNPTELSDEDKLTLLKKLQNRTLTSKLSILGNRSTTQFDFLSEMDGQQILELIRTESMTVKSIILTQCDPQKRSSVYSQMDPEIRMSLLTELSRIDYLPKDYIYNVANALKRKKHENPRLNTEALPGSDVLVSLLERTGLSMQKSVVSSLESTNPDSARTVKSKLVSIDTLKYLRDGQLLEVVLSLKHEELLQFLKGTTEGIRKTIYAKSPQELVIELEEELAQITSLSREAYQGVERKVLNRMKIMATEGQINLIETNERMFSGPSSSKGSFVEGAPADFDAADPNTRRAG